MPVLLIRHHSVIASYGTSSVYDSSFASSSSLVSLLFAHSINTLQSKDLISTGFVSSSSALVTVHAMELVRIGSSLSLSSQSCCYCCCFLDAHILHIYFSTTSQRRNITFNACLIVFLVFLKLPFAGSVFHGHSVL